MKQQIKQMLILGVLLMAACVSTKKFNTMQQQNKNRYDSLFSSSQSQLKSCADANAGLTAQNSALQGQVNDFSGSCNPCAYSARLSLPFLLWFPRLSSGYCLPHRCRSHPSSSRARRG